MKLHHLALVSGLSLLLPMAASAAVITASFAAPSDNLITRDLANHTEWLDVSATVNMSRNSALATYGASGFRSATAAELTALYISAGIDDVWNESTGLSVYGTANTFANVTSAAGIAALGNLYSMMGGGAANFGGNSWIHGFLADENANGYSFLGRFGVESLMRYAHVNTNGDGWAAAQTHGAIGSFLVRNVAAVPEPSSIALLGIALVGLGISRRRA